MVVRKGMDRCLHLFALPMCMKGAIKMRRTKEGREGKGRKGKDRIGKKGKDREGKDRKERKG